MRTFHANWAFIAVGLNLIVGGWGLLWVRNHLPAPLLFWPMVFAGQGAIAIQVVIGLILRENFPSVSAMHVFYGFVLLIAAAVSYAFRGQDPKRNVTAFSLVAAFIGVVGAARGIPTGFA